jgi:hypothetical protein
MGDKFEVQICDGYILFKVNWPLDLDRAQTEQWRNKLTAACAKSGSERLLVEVDENLDRFSFVEIFEVATYLTSLGRMKIAFFSNNPYIRQHAEFFSLVVTNRRGHAKFFVDREEAVNWLISG